MSRPPLAREATPEDWAFSRLSSFCRYMWPGYESAAHLRLIAEKLEAVERREIDRLIVTLPPRHGKSHLITERFPAWYLGRNPTAQVMVGTYGQRLADKWGRRTRNQLQDPRFGKVFPGVGLAGDSQAASAFETSQGGSYFATGRGGAATGLGADLFIVDDPTKDRQEAESHLIQDAIRDWYTDVVTTRLMPGGAVVIVMTRWVDFDLVGFVLKEHAHEGWTVVNLPALAEAGEEDALGRLPGEALWPERYPVAALERKRATLPPRSWASLYQQKPVPKEGNVVKPEWFRRRFQSPPWRPLRIVQSWDTARKAKEKNDPSVCGTWAETAEGYYLLDVWRERVEYPELRQAARNQAAKWNPDLILVEDSANGSALVQDLERVERLPLVLVPTGAQDKESRLDRVTPLMEGGLVWLPESASWLAAYEEEMLRFPAGLHDDQVDMTSQALGWFLARRREPDDDDLPLLLGRPRASATLSDY